MTPSTRTWEFVSGADIEYAYLNQASLQELLPQCEAIYLWRRRFSPTSAAIHDGAHFIQWLEGAMQAPTAEVTNQQLAHFAVLDRLTIRGQGLTPTKRQLLARLAAKPQTRQWLVRYVHTLGQFSPPLYCGETAKLAQRVKDHVSAETGFGRHVHEGALPAWSDLELAFHALRPAAKHDELRAKERRTLVETITTAFTVSGYVARPG